MAINMAHKGTLSYKQKYDERNGYMTRFYYKTFKPTLAKRVEELLSESLPLDQLKIDEELALIRVTAQDAVELYSNVSEQKPNDVEARLSAGIVMSTAMQNVIKAVDTASKIEEVKQKVAGAFVNSMSAVCTAVMRAAWDAFGDDYRMKIFEDKLKEHLVIREVPGAEGLDGTTLMPYDDALAMDASVPAVPGEAAEAEPEE